MKSDVSFLYIGIFSYIIQIILVREFINIFYGNEFFIAATLFLWLFSTGIGSLLYQRFRDKIKFELEIYFYLSVYFSVLVVLNRFFAGFVKNPGEGFDIFIALVFMFFEVFPLCFLIGYIFPFFVEKYNSVLSRSYMIENIGFIVAGVVFYVFLIKKGVVYSIGFLLFLSGVILLREKRVFSFISFVLCLIVIILNQNFEKITLRNIFKNENIVLNSYTPKGKITVTERFNQFNFYYNNVLLSSDEETFKNELKIHLPFLFSEKIENVLYIGTPLSGILNEIYKYNPKKIVYLDIDEYLVESLAGYLKDDLKQSISRSFVKKDVYEFVLNSKDRFDVIVLDIPPPSSLGINRFYSVEFFEKIKRLTDKNSVVVIYFKYSAGYITTEIKKANVLLYHTLKKIFDYVLYFPDEENIFVLLDRKPYDYEFYLKKFKSLNIDIKTLSYQYVNWRFRNDRVDEFKKFIEEEKISVNSFLNPEVYVYNILNQIRVFYPSFSNFYIYLLNSRFLLSAFFIVFLYIIIYFVVKKDFDRVFLKISVLSFSVISFEIISIYLFEVNFGKPVEAAGVVITLIMFGISTGSSLRKNISDYRILYLSVLLFGGYFLFLVFSYKIFLFLLTFFLGFLLGFSFRIFSERISYKDGCLLYGFDILGSVFGVLITSVFLIPLYGIEYTIGIIILVFLIFWLI